MRAFALALPVGQPGEAFRDGIRDELRSARDIQLAHDRAAVPLDGPGGDAHPLPDFLVVEAFADMGEHQLLVVAEFLRERVGIAHAIEPQLLEALGKPAAALRGSYSAVVSDVNNASGVALIEVDEVN